MMRWEKVEMDDVAVARDFPFDHADENVNGRVAFYACINFVLLCKRPSLENYFYRLFLL